MKGHSEPGRASSFSPLLHSPHHLLSLFQPSFSQEQNNNKLNWEKTREVCPHLWHPLKGCYWKRIQKCVEGFCVSFSGSLGRSLCTQSGETGVVISAQKPFISGYHQEDLANCLSCLWIQGFWKDPKQGLWLFQSSFFFSSLFLLRPLCSLLSVSPLLPTTAPAVGTRARGAGGQVTSESRNPHWASHQSQTKE